MFHVCFVVASAIWHSTNEGYDKEHIKSILGVLKGGPIPPPKVLNAEELERDLPDAYDVHTAHPECSGEINDQSTCGSCWAVSAAETMTDRLCLGGLKHLRLSAEDILSCCVECGDGCNGGFPSAAWEYFATSGVVDGGPFGDSSHCTHYPFAPCAHHINSTKLPTCGDVLPTPPCPRHCENSETWNSAKVINISPQSSYSVAGEDSMMRDLVANGPITVAFTVYEDFPTYKSGVYEADTTGEILGGHAVECVGYGVDSETDGKPYWRIKNSWNKYWGENGYFRIVRGVDECGIESDGVAGLVKTKSVEMMM